jgi:hypothetical protein
MAGLVTVVCAGLVTNCAVVTVCPPAME